MSFREQTSVRSRATSELLFIERIDAEAAIAYCQHYGPSGPEGPAEPFPLDSLRENAVRVSRQIETVETSSRVRRLLCRVGLHSWDKRTFPERPLIGALDGKICRYCAETHLAGPPARRDRASGGLVQRWRSRLSPGR